MDAKAEQIFTQSRADIEALRANVKNKSLAPAEATKEITRIIAKIIEVCVKIRMKVLEEVQMEVLKGVVIGNILGVILVVCAAVGIVGGSMVICGASALGLILAGG